MNPAELQTQINLLQEQVSSLRQALEESRRENTLLRFFRKVGAGPSHELPTGGAGTMFAGLTVHQFQRRTSVVELSRKALDKSLPAREAFGTVEGLDAHVASARIDFISLVRRQVERMSAYVRGEQPKVAGLITYIVMRIRLSHRRRCWRCYAGQLTASCGCIRSDALACEQSWARYAVSIRMRSSLATAATTS